MPDIDLDQDFDFGFTTHTDEELASSADVEAAQNKAAAMYKAIMPLLNNLAKDADKNAYIHWPNRADKIEQFKQRLADILNG